MIRNFEIIGEACRNFDSHHPELTQDHPEVPWGFAYEMRNALAHGYFKVDLEIVWKTVHNDLPDLAGQIHSLLSKTHEI
ncbi:MAG: HepT-like ribonuclease domain-containing protein [Thiobacillus sp.]